MRPVKPKRDQPGLPTQRPEDEDMDENYSSATEDEKRAVQAYLLARPRAEIAPPSMEDNFCQPCEPAASHTERPSQRCNQACEIGIWHKPCPHACRRAARHLGCHDCLHHAVTSDLAATASYASTIPDSDVAPLKRQRFEDWPVQNSTSQPGDNEAIYAKADNNQYQGFSQES